MADAASIGRLQRVLKNSVVFAGVRSSGINWGGEPPDVTTGEDNSYRTSLSVVSQQQLTITIEGISKNELLRTTALTTATKRLTDVSFEFSIVNDANSTNATLTGNFDLTAYEEGAPYNEGVTFSATFQSSGSWTYTAEAL